MEKMKSWQIVEKIDFFSPISALLSAILGAISATLFCTEHYIWGTITTLITLLTIVAAGYFIIQIISFTEKWRQVKKIRVL